MFDEKTLANVYKKPESGRLLVYRPEGDEWHYWVSDSSTMFRVGNNFPLLQKRDLFPELPAAGETFKLNTAEKTPAEKLEGDVMLPEYIEKRKAEEQEPLRILPWTLRDPDRKEAHAVRRLFAVEETGEIIYADQKYIDCLLGDGVMENYDYSRAKGRVYTPLLVWVGNELAGMIGPMDFSTGIKTPCRFERRGGKHDFFYVEGEA